MKRLIVALLVLACFVPLVSAGILQSDNVSFYYNITDGMGTQTDYQVKFILSNSSGTSGYYAPDNIIYTGGTTLPTWLDVNATDGSDAPLPFWIENNTQTATNATAWVKVPSIATGNTSTGKWYYGNASQTASTMSGINTFLTFDDMSDATYNATLWAYKTGSGGAVTEGAGELVVSATGAGNYGINTSQTFPINTSTLIRGKHNSTFGASLIARWGYSITPAGATGSKYAFIQEQNNNFIGYSYSSGATSNNIVASDTNYHIISTTRNTSGSVIHCIDTTCFANTTQVPTDAEPVAVYSSGTNSRTTTDWYAVRKYVFIEPITSTYVTGVTPLSASFTQAPNPSSTGQAVTFTDTSEGSPTTWNWTIGGVVTNTTQNAAYIFSTAGTYAVNLNVTNASGAFSDISQNQVVVNASSLVPQDIWMEGQYVQTFNVIDSGTHLAISNVTVTADSGQTNVTTAGTATLTMPFGSSLVSFISNGYTTRQIAYVFDEDASHTVELTASDTATSEVVVQEPPKEVQFHVQSFFGTPITDATVTIQGITTTTGSWDWIVTLLGIPLDEVALNGTAMTGTTDSLGNLEFLMIPTAKYNVTTTASGYTFPPTFITPHDLQYTLVANMNGTGWFESGNDTLADVNVSVSWVTKNATHAFVNITYDDQNIMTTGGTITVYLDSVGRKANATPITSMDITGSSCSNSTIVDTPTGGASYNVVVNATTASGDNIVRSFTHYFKGSPVMLPGWTSETLLWLALFIIIFTAGFAGALHSPQMAVILCVEAWVFWGIGWLDYLLTGYWYAESAILVVLVLATAITFWWNITEGKAKGKRSS